MYHFILLFIGLIAIPTNLTEGQQRTVDYLLKFLHAADELLLQACLQFITGSACVPPMGFNKQITLEFTDEKRLPFARTCTLEIQLSSAYTSFELDMKLSVKEHGFYCLYVIYILMMASLKRIVATTHAPFPCATFTSLVHEMADALAIFWDRLLTLLRELER